jgi:hypothetical protein
MVFPVPSVGDHGVVDSVADASLERAQCHLPGFAFGDLAA